MSGYVIMKKSRHYTGGKGRTDTVYATVEEAQAVADELSKTNPVGFEVVPYKEA